MKNWTALLKLPLLEEVHIFIHNWIQLDFIFYTYNFSLGVIPHIHKSLIGKKGGPNPNPKAWATLK